MEIFSAIFSKISSIFTKTRQNYKEGTTSSFASKKMMLVIFIFLGVAVALLFGLFSMSNINVQSEGSKSEKSNISPAQATTKINQEFSFPIKDEKGVTISDVKYLIDNAQVQDEIIVQGQKATAVQGRAFLILSLKLTNNHNQPIQINTRDYMRISIGDKSELLAPDIHNDPVEIQPISTKYTRLGIPINENDKQFKLHIGEITGDKQQIEVQF